MKVFVLSKVVDLINLYQFYLILNSFIKFFVTELPII